MSIKAISMDYRQVELNLTFEHWVRGEQKSELKKPLSLLVEVLFGSARRFKTPGPGMVIGRTKWGCDQLVYAHWSASFKAQQFWKMDMFKPGQLPHQHFNFICMVGVEGINVIIPAAS